MSLERLEDYIKHLHATDGFAKQFEVCKMKFVVSTDSDETLTETLTATTAVSLERLRTTRRALPFTKV